MRIPLPSHRRRRSEAGFAVVVIVILLAIMTAMAIGNNIALAHLRSELKLVDKRQQQRHDNVHKTNAPANRASAPKPQPSPAPDSPARPPVK